MQGRLQFQKINKLNSQESKTQKQNFIVVFNLYGQNKWYLQVICPHIFINAIVKKDIKQKQRPNPDTTPLKTYKNSTQVLTKNQNHVYSLSGQSQFKCHFVLKKIYMPRKQSIQRFFARLQKIIKIYGPVYTLQLSNVYKNQVVDVDVGMIYDKDAIVLVRHNNLIKLPNRDGLYEYCRLQPSTSFNMFLKRESLLVDIQKSSINTRAEQNIQEIIETKVQPPVVYSGRLVSIKIIGVPKQYSEQLLLQAFSKYPYGQIIVEKKNITQKNQLSINYFQVYLPPCDADMLIQKGFQIRGIPLLVLQKRQCALKSQLSQYQIHVNSTKQKIDARKIYEMFIKYGPIVNLYDPSGQDGKHLVITFSTKIAAQMATDDIFEDVVVTQANKSYMLKLKRISIRSSFYSSLIFKNEIRSVDVSKI